MSTIAFQGIASSTNKIYEIIAKVKSFSVKNEWVISNSEADSILVIPHHKCEPLFFSFDKKLKFSGLVKTVYAPIDVHYQLVSLFFEVKPLFKKLIIDDETGYWDSFIEEKENKKLKEIVSFPEVSKELIISKPLILPEYAAPAG